MHILFSRLSSAESNGPDQQAFVGLIDANGPNMPLGMDITTEQAQPENGLIFASYSPAPIKDTNSTKTLGKGP